MLCLCLCVPSRKTYFQVDWILLVKERIANIGKPLDMFWVFVVSMIFLCFEKNKYFFGSLQTNLLGIVGELAGAGSVDVAVGVSDR